MKWILSLNAVYRPTEIDNVLEMSESPTPEHSYFAQYVKELKNRNDWNEVTGKFRIFKRGKGSVVIEIDCLEES